MPKHDDRHLTTLQLSALIDKQLSQEELALCNAHLQSCQQCQNALAGLQQTVTLLHALPQAALPRSFVLPGGVTYLQERPEHREERQTATNRAPARQRSWLHYVQRSLRAASAIAAVIGLVFLLSGILPMLAHGGAGSGASTTANTAPLAKPKMTAATTPAQKTATHGQNGGGEGTPVTTPRAGSTPATVTHPSNTRNQNQSTTRQPSTPLPLSDLSTPLGRQVVGFILLVLGIVGVLLTIRKQRGRQRTR